MELGVAPGAGVVMNSGELLSVIGRDGEKERDWKRSEKKGIARLFSRCSYRPQQAWGLRHDCGDGRDASVTAVHDSSTNHCNILARGRGVDVHDDVSGDEVTAVVSKGCVDVELFIAVSSPCRRKEEDEDVDP
jgi:hypothetical protein